MHHSTFIAHLASIYKPSVYVELGLYEGETLKKVYPFAKKIYGVDLKTNPQLEGLKNISNIELHFTSTDLFFANFNGSIDMAFIDADHNSQSVLKDFENVLKRLNPGGVILLHDTDPEADRFIHPGYCGDSFKIVKMFEERQDLNITTLPILEAGLSIVTKKNNTRTQRRHSKESLISPS
jgi:hypothetical protein